MGAHVVLDVNRLAISSATESTPRISRNNLSQSFLSSGRLEHSIVLNSSSHSDNLSSPSKLLSGISSGPTLNRAAGPCNIVLPSKIEALDSSENDIVECRICQEEEEVGNLEAPCACSGSLKYAHRKCVQRWCNEKGDTTCEICHQPYRSGYITPPRQVDPDSVPIELSEDWGIPGTRPLEIRDPRILAMAAAQRHFLDAEYEEYAAANSNGAACCRSAALILMALLLLRHALAMAAVSADEDASMFFTLFLLRAVGFLLPCYIMARAMNMLQRRRQRQDAAIAAAEVAILLQAGEARGMRFSLTPGPSINHELA